MNGATLATQKTRAWGLWVALVEVDGCQFEGWGPSAALASYRARRRATHCDKCEKSVGEPEARVSRLALGRVLCADCRARVYGPSTDPDEEA